MANCLTAGRMILGAALLFFPALSPAFYILYSLAGFTDMIDGTVARKTGTAGAFGARLDTAADMVFAGACFWKLLPVLKLPLWLWIWTGMIAVVKGASLLLGYLLRGKFVAEHTVLNKIAGAALFLLPFTVAAVDLTWSAAAVCAIATLAALQEGYLVTARKR